MKTVTYSFILFYFIINDQVNLLLWNINQSWVIFMNIALFHPILILETMAFPVKLQHVNIPVAEFRHSEGNLILILLERIVFRQKLFKFL